MTILEEFPYKYIIFKQTPNNYLLLAGFMMQFPTALERGLYTPIMYFKKDENDLTLYGHIHPINAIPYRMIKCDLYDFESLLPAFDTLEDKEYLNPVQIIGEYDLDNNYTNYFLDKYYVSLVSGDNQERLDFSDYILNRNK